MAILNDEQDWRFGLRVKLLKKTVIHLSPCFLFPIHWLISSLMYAITCYVNLFRTSLAKIIKAGEIQILRGIRMSKHLIRQLM